MHFSVPASFLIHGAILLWAFMHILHTPELDAPRQESIEVAIVTPSDILRLKKGSESSKELEAKAQEVEDPDVSKKQADKAKPLLGAPPAEEPPPPEEDTSDPIAEQIAAAKPEPQPDPGPTPEELKKIEEQKQAEKERKADHDEQEARVSVLDK